MARLAQIWRHPIKGIGAEPLQAVRLTPDRPLPLDRAFAVLTGEAQDTGAWQACRNFARGCYGPELMAVRATCDGGRITLTHPRRPALTVDPAEDSAALVEWLTPLYPDERPAPHRLIAAPATGMADVAFPSVSVLGLASLRALSDRLGKALDPRRFRGNLWADQGLEPFEESTWVGRMLRIGSAELHVEERITRCRATEANPDTGTRDADTLQALRDGWGHTDFGVYARVIRGGDIGVGDGIEVL